MFGRAVQTGDRVALRKIVTAIPAPIAHTASAIGTAASGGLLWFVSAAVLSALGRRGRRSAASGLLAYGTASVIANGSAKWLVRRRRPHGLLLAGLRRRGGSPRTSSFPSSHTASAVAFTVAASLELPPAAPALAVSATAVALSRLRAVRHFPTDVIGGVVLGAGVGGTIAVVTRRQFPAVISTVRDDDEMNHGRVGGDTRGHGGA